MAKVGENVPILIDKTIDLIASSQASRGCLNKTPSRNVVPSEVSQENAWLYLQHLAYHRQSYQPQQPEK